MKQLPNVYPTEKTNKIQPSYLLDPVHLPNRDSIRRLHASLQGIIRAATVQSGTKRSSTNVIAAGSACLRWSRRIPVDAKRRCKLYLLHSKWIPGGSARRICGSYIRLVSQFAGGVGLNLAWRGSDSSREHILNVFSSV